VTETIFGKLRPFVGVLGKTALTTALLVSLPAFAQQAPLFTPGNLVVVVEGCGVIGGTCAGVANGTGTGTGNSSLGGYGDNQAAPMTLFQYSPMGTQSAAYVNSVVLPQTASGANFPVSAEYGSSSEGTLQLSGNDYYLAVMGYGVSVADFNANPPAYGAAPSNALAQSGSLTGQSYTPVARVIALIDAYGRVTSSTGIYNIFDTNNPRSVYTADGVTAAYVSGQGSGSDATGGVFYTALGAVNNTPTPITGLDTTGNTIAQDTRDVQIVNGTLMVSVDSKEGSGSNRDYIGTLGTAGTPPTTTVGAPVMLSGFGDTKGHGQVTITSGTNNTGNGLNTGLQINLSPVNYFFANASTLYVTDSGDPKQTSANSSLGDGGLQKWINSKTDGSGTWSLAYTLHNQLPLVSNSSSTGTCGLYGLAGVVQQDGTVELYATNYTLSDLDPTFLYGITDTLSYTTASQAASEQFAQLAAAPADSNFKGVAFSPAAIPPTTPTITWTTPAAISFGSALSSVQLDATASVPGTFSYSPTAGTVLPVAANQTLSVTFTPTDTIDYTTATATTTITVNPATPASLVVTRLLSRSAGNVVVQVTIANTGGSEADNVVLSTVKVGADSATPLPQTIGTIAAGGSATTTVTVPGTVGASGAASTISISGTYNGGTFSASGRITLP
jgi:hypothetical protein